LSFQGKGIKRKAGHGNLALEKDALEDYRQKVDAGGGSGVGKKRVGRSIAGFYRRAERDGSERLSSVQKGVSLTRGNVGGEKNGEDHPNKKFARHAVPKLHWGGRSIKGKGSDHFYGEVTHTKGKGGKKTPMAYE